MKSTDEIFIDLIREWERLNPNGTSQELMDFVDEYVFTPIERQVEKEVKS